MQRFHFALERVWRVRQRRVQLAQAALAGAQAGRAAAVEQWHAASQQYAEAAAAVCAGEAAGVTGAVFLSGRLQLRHLQRRVEQAAQAVQLQTRAVTDCQQRVLDERRAEKALAKLHERRWAAYQAELLRSEQRELDEIALRRPGERGGAALWVVLVMLLLLVGSAAAAYFFIPGVKSGVAQLPLVGRLLPAPKPPAASGAGNGASPVASLEQQRLAVQQARAQVDARAAELDALKQQLDARQKDLDQRTAEVKRREAEVQGRAATISRLAGIYKSMKAAEAAAILGEMDNQTVAAVLVQMEDVSAAKILAAMPPTKAALLSGLMRTEPAKTPAASAAAGS